jgi:hypothetical protein
MLGEVPVNWLFLATAGVATALFPPLGLIAAGVELALLYGLTHSERFQNVVKGRRLLTVKLSSDEVWGQQREALLSRIGDDSTARFELLERRADTARRTHQENLGEAFDDFLDEGLHRLQSLYLTLLHSSETLAVQITAGQRADLADELEEAESQLKGLTDSADQRIAKSVRSTIVILNRRLGNLATAKQNTTYIESELRRIEHQTELLIEEAALTKDPDEVARRIDAVTSTFDETQDWVKQNQTLLKEVGFDLAVDSPRLPRLKQDHS